MRIASAREPVLAFGGGGDESSRNAKRTRDPTATMRTTSKDVEKKRVVTTASASARSNPMPSIEWIERAEDRTAVSSCSIQSRDRSIGASRVRSALCPLFYITPPPSLA